MVSLVFVAALILCEVLGSGTSRIRIEDNGYQDVLIALPANTKTSDTSTIVSALERLIHGSSSVLQLATRGRAIIRSVTVLVPHGWDLTNIQHINSTSLQEAGSALTRGNADIVVTDDEGSDQPYTLHQGECGRPALRIYVPMKFLMSGIISQDNAVEFVRLWSEFRYGIFPEGGFEDDEMYPATYRLPGESTNKTTGCSDKEFKTSTSCSDDETCPFVSSVMDQHLPPTVRRFCENEFSLGPKHNPHSPSKHNLLCKEEGTWLILLRSEDFARGRNSAPKHPPDSAPTIVYAKESLTPAVMVGIDISSRMKLQSRYSFVKNAFSRFVLNLLPDGTQMTLFLFGGVSDEVLIAREPHVLDDKIAKIAYLEQLVLPEILSEKDDPCTDCVLDSMFELVDNGTVFSPVIVLVATGTAINTTRYSELKQKILDSNIRLNVLCFSDDESTIQESSLNTLCSETGGHFISLKSDLLRDLYRGFSDIVEGPAADMLIHQEYLSLEDEEDLTIPFFVDEYISGPIQILLSGFHLGESPLEYDKTFLSGPISTPLYPEKQELLPAWIITVPSPLAGVYTLSTRRKEGAITPILVTISGKFGPGKDPISVKVRTEVLFESKISPPPVRIFAEVRKGPQPVAGATVTAYVSHPHGETSVLPLLDDGLGDVDITKEDGIYGEYFTNFTSTGFYNVYVQVAGGLNGSTEFLKGPSGYCCGSFFSPNERKVFNHPFQRMAGPVTFKVDSLPHSDVYPPSRVTNLRLYETYDTVHVLQWTAVGNNYTQGFAQIYELKLLPDRSIIRNRFSDSGFEIYNETIEATHEASYGIPLVHAVNLPKTTKGGVYYFAVRALDAAGNAGEPSNALPVWVEPVQTSLRINCNNDDQPSAQRLVNSASKFIPLVSLLFWIIILQNL